MIPVVWLSFLLLIFQDKTPMKDFLIFWLLSARILFYLSSSHAADRAGLPVLIPEYNNLAGPAQAILP